MPGGVHLLLGLILTLFINFFLRRTKNGTKLTSKEEKERSEDSENMKLGFVVGGILPDGDICLVILVLIFTYTCLGYGLETNRFLAELIHRSFTHSFLLLFPILGYIVYKYHYCDTRTQKILGFQVNLPFALGCVVSMIVHTIFDTCYMKGVRFLFPLFNEEIFFEIPSLGLYEFEKYGPILQKFLLTFDHLTEVMFYCLLMWARSRMHYTNGDNLTNADKRSKLFKDFNIARIWRELTEQDWQHIFKYVCIVQTILLWVWFAIGLFVVPMFIERQMHYDEYMVFLYFPGTVFLIVSLLSPLAFSSVIKRWDWRTVLQGRSKTMRYADGAIMKEMCTLSCCSNSHAIKQE